jgi:hypothetical protein
LIRKKTAQAKRLAANRTYPAKIGSIDLVFRSLAYREDVAAAP